MRTYEFGGIDVQAEIHRLHKRRSKFSITNESEQSDTEYITTFLASAEGYSVLESELVIGNYYFPIDILYNSLERKLTIILVVQQAEYVGIAGSRLEFRYNTNSKSLFFPTDESLTDSEYRYVFSNRNELDQIVSVATMKFNNTDWDFQAFGFDLTGTIQRITNLG
jgi:hypothetical protein